MRKIFFATLALATALSSSAENKFDARSRMIAGQYDRFVDDPSSLLIEAKDLPFATDIMTRSSIRARALVILSDGATAADLEAAGMTIVAGRKSVRLVEGTMDDIIALADSETVKSVSFGKEAYPMLDMARTYTGVDAIHSGSDGLPRAYTGKGVITAIFDQGIYPDHYNFKDADGNCRITNLWHYTSNDGKVVKHYDSPESVTTLTTDDASSSHGTHTLGCMAGKCHQNVKSLGNYNQRTGEWDVVGILDRNGKPVPFYGMSTESEIIAAAGKLSDENMMAGIQEMADYIAESGRPGVINISIGSMIGPHDGLDAFTKFLDEIAEDIPVVISSGNDGDGNVSISGYSYKTFVVPSAGVTTDVFSGKIDIWSDKGDAISVTPLIYDMSTNQIVYSFPTDKETEATITTNNYGAGYINAPMFNRAFSSSYWLISAKKDPANDRYNFTLDYKLAYNENTNAAANLVFGIMVEGKQGQRIDLVHISGSSSQNTPTLSDMSLSGWSSGSSAFSINSMACGKNSIAVGAWNTRNAWGIVGKKLYYYPNADALGMGLDDVAGYSSYGTLIDGRTKPDFCSPGTGIISSVSTPGMSSLDSGSYPCAQYDSGSRKDMWGIMQGTSMASPIVAGAVALWLEADPTLTPAQIREIAISSCDNDRFTASGDPVKWGAGKFNALAGLKKILGISGIKGITGDSGDRVSITQSAERSWTVVIPGAKEVSAVLYNTSGQAVASAKSDGEETTVDASSIAPGIYVLSANCRHNTRIAIR